MLDAHVSLRGCQGPADMSTCPDEVEPAGLGSIAEQTVDHHVDVLMGGGRDRFDQATYTNQTVIERAQAAGHQVATDQACTESNPVRPFTEPHLLDMTKEAIRLLDAKSKHGHKSFSLQVEGASIDKQDHAANPCGQIGETVELDRSIAFARQWARSHPDTLIIVTADHGHEPDRRRPAVGDRSQPGRHRHADHGRPPAHGRQRRHEPARTFTEPHRYEVRIAAQGPQTANVVGITDQTDLFHTMSRALGVE